MQNISLYIKRAESYHTKEYISSVLESQRYGKVSDAQFIEKTDKTGRNYNGVILKFSYFENNELTKNLLKTLQSTPNANCIIKHNLRLKQYWNVGLYVDNHFAEALPTDLSPLLSVNNNKDSTDKEKLEELQQLIQILSLKNTLLLKMNKKYEAESVKYEVEQTQMILQNAELEEQLKEKDRECAFNISNTVKELANYKSKCLDLEQELDDQNNIIAYLSSDINYFI